MIPRLTEGNASFLAESGDARAICSTDHWFSLKSYAVNRRCRSRRPSETTPQLQAEVYCRNYSLWEQLTFRSNSLCFVLTSHEASRMVPYLLLDVQDQVRARYEQRGSGF